MTYAVTFLNKQGHERKEYIVADDLYTAVQTCKLLDNVAQVKQIIQAPHD